MRLVLAALAVWSLAGPASAAEKEPYGLLLQGAAAEEFLKTAEVGKMKAVGVGITHPYRADLTDGTRTLRAIWKTIDESRPGVTRFEGGGFDTDFRDTYKFEIAAYELDKLIGLDLVPPTVEREVKGQRGSLQLWVEGTMTEAERQKRKVAPPDREAWNAQMYKVRLLHQLTFNSDRANIRNVLIDPGFRIYAVDNSRAFRRYHELPSEKDLARFSRSALEGLRRLDLAVLKEKLGPWLTTPEIEALLKRRDLILARAEQQVKERGEAAVLYP